MRNERKRTERSALSLKDPAAIASALELPSLPISISNKSTNRQRHTIKLSLNDNNGTDWACVNFLVAAHNAALDASSVMF